MADGPNLQLDALNSLIDRLDQVLVKIDQVSKRIEGLSDIKISVKLSKNTLQSAKELDTLTRAIDRLMGTTKTGITKAANNLQLFITKINALDKAFDDSKFKATNLRSVIKTLEDLTMLDLKIASINPKFFEFLDGLLKVIQTLTDLSSKVDGRQINATRRLLQETGTVIEYITNFFGKSKFGNLLKAIKFNTQMRLVVGSYLGVFSTLVTLTDGVKPSQVKRARELVKESFFVIAEVINVATELETTNIGIVKALKLTASFGTFIKQFFRIMSILSIMAQGMRNQDVSRAKTLVALGVEVIGFMIETFDDLSRRGKIGGVGFTIKFGLIVGQFTNLVRNLVFSTRGLQTVKITAIGNLVAATSSAVGKIVDFYDKFRNVNFIFGAAKQAIKFRIAVEGLLSVVRAVIKLASGASAEQMNGIGELLRGLSDAIRFYIDYQVVLKNIRFDQAISRTIKFRFLAEGLIATTRSLVKVSNAAPAESIAAVGEVVRNVGSALRAFASFVQTVIAFTTDNRTGINKFLQAVRAFTAVFAFMQIFTSGIAAILLAAAAIPAANIQGLGLVLDSIFKLFARIIRAATFETDPKLLKDRVKSLRDIAEAIRPLFKSLKGVRPESLEHFPRVVLALEKIYKGLTRVDDNSTVDFKTLNRNIKSFGQFVRSITPLFQSLKGVKVGSFAGLDSFVRAVFATFKDLQQVDAIKFDGKQIRKFAKNLGTALREISNSLDRNLDVKKIEKLSKSVETLEKATRLASSISPIAPRANEDVQKLSRSSLNLEETTEAVRSGFLRANLQITLVRSGLNGLVAIFRTLASVPGRFFNALKSGATSALGFINQLNNAWKNIITNVRQGLREIADQADNLINVGQNLINNFGIGKFFQSSAFDAAAEFDDLSNRVQVFGRLTEEQTAAAQEFASVIGRDYPQTSNEALAAIEDLIKAGLDLEQIYSVLPAAADLSALSDTKDLDLATSAVIRSVSAFDEVLPGVESSFENANRIADVFSGVADVTTSSFESLAPQVAEVGAIANGLNLTLLDTTSILAALQEGGLTEELSGGTFRSLFTNLNTAPAQAELKRLGVSLTDAEGNFRDMDAVIKDLNAALNQTQEITIDVVPGTSNQDRRRVELAQKTLRSATLSLLQWEDGLASGSGDAERATEKIEEYRRQIAAAEQVIAEVTGSQETANRVTVEITRSQQENFKSIKALGGAYGQTALSILLARDGFDDIRQEVLASTSAQERAQQLMDSFRGDVEQLQGSLESLLTKGLVPLLEDFFRPFVQFADFVVDALAQLDQSVLSFVATGVLLSSTFATISGGFLVFLGGTTKVGATVLRLTSYMFSLRQVIIGLGGFILSFTAGLLSLAAAAAVVIVPITALVGVIRIIQQVFKENSGNATTLFKGFIFELQEIFGELFKLGESIANFARVLFGTSSPSENSFSVLDAVGGMITRFFNRIVIALNTGTIAKLREGVKQVTDVFNFFTQAFSLEDRISTAQKETRRAMRQFGDEFLSTGDEIEYQVVLAGGNISKAFIELTKSLSQRRYLRQLFNREQLTPNDLLIITKNVGEIGQSIGRAVTGVVQDVKKFFRTLERDGIGPAIDGFIDDVKVRFSTLKSEILPLFFSIFNITDTELQTSIAADPEAVFRNFLEVQLLKIRLGIVRVIRENQEFFRGVFVRILNILFNPLKKVELIADLLGADTVSNIVGEINRIISDIFGGIFDTALGLLEGKTLVEALREAFGPSIDPILTFASQLGDAVDSIVNIISKLAGSIFGEGREALDEADARGSGTGGIDPSTFITEPPGGFEGLLQRVSGIFTTIGNIISFINTNILDPLEAGDVNTALGNVGTIIGKILSDVSTEIGRIVGTLDPAAIFESAITAVRNLLADALKLALNTVGNLTGIDVTTIVDTINDTITNSPDLQTSEGVEGPFAVAAGAIVTAFAVALQTAFLGLGEILNIDTATVVDNIRTKLGDLVTTINEVFAGSDGTSIFDNLATFVTNFTTALGLLISALSPKEGEGADTDTVSTLEQLFTSLGDFLARLPGLPLDILNGVITFLDELSAALADLDPEEIQGIGGVLGSIGLGLLAFKVVNGTALTSVSTGIKNLASGIKNFANSTAGKALGILSIVLIIKNLLEQVDTFKSAIDQISQGDFGGGLLTFLEGLANTALGAGFDLIQLLGLDKLFGFTEEGVQKTISQIELLARIAGNNIRVLFENTILKFFTEDLPREIQKAINDIRLRIALAQGDISELLGQGSNADDEAAVSQLFNLGNLLSSGDFGPNSTNLLVEALRASGAFNTGDPTLNALIAERAKIIADEFSGDLVDSFLTLDSNGQLTDSLHSQFAEIFKTLGLASVLGDVEDQTGVDGVVLFLDKLIGDEILKAGIDQTVLDSMANEILSGFAGLDGDSRLQALNLLEILAADLNLSPETVEKIKKTLLGEIEAIKNSVQEGLIGPQEPSADGQNIPVSTGIDFTLDLDKFTVTNAEEGQQKIVDEVVPETPPVIPFQTELTNQEDVNNLALDLEELKTATDEAKASLDTVATAAPTIVTQLNAIEAAVVAIETNGKPAVQNVIDKIGVEMPQILAGLPLLMAEPINLIIGEFQRLRDGALPAIDKVNDALKKLISQLDSALGKINAISEAGKGGGFTPPDNTPPGAARGVNFGPGQVYEVAEAGASELLAENGKLFLLTGTTGSVVPLDKLSQFQLGGPIGRQAPSVNNNSNSSIQIINEGISVQVVAPAGVNANQVAQRTAEILERQLQERDRALIRQLRTGARS